jgi:hypothetical protein
LQFEDGLDFSSTRDMPETVTIIALNGSLGNSRHRVEFRFDDDLGRFDYSGNVANFYPGALDLRDRTASGRVELFFEDPIEARVQNLAVIWDENHSWEANGFFTGGVESFNALDGIPEFVGNATVLSFGSNLGSGLVPVFEISDDVDESVDRYIVTAPSGQAILDAYLATVERQTQTPIQKVVGQVLGATTTELEFIGPLQPEQEQNNLFERELLELDSVEDAERILSEINTVAGYIEMTLSSIELIRQGYSPQAIVTYLLAEDLIASSLEELGLPKNQAESLASTISLGLEVAVGGGVVSAAFYALEQAELIIAASAALQEANLQALEITFDTAQSTLDAFLNGGINEELALSVLESLAQISDELAGNIAWKNSRDIARRMWIVSQMAALRIEEGPLGLSTLSSAD